MILKLFIFICFLIIFYPKIEISFLMTFLFFLFKNSAESLKDENKSKSNLQKKGKLK